MMVSRGSWWVSLGVGEVGWGHPWRMMRSSWRAIDEVPQRLGYPIVVGRMRREGCEGVRRKGR